ncbi:DivIVA domain-containing protein [Eubacteriales bacterium mix99]
MSLTPMDIHNKEFARKFRGYQEDEVDEFLDAIVDEFEKLHKENIDLKDKVHALEDQVNQYKTMEQTLKDTLVTAQKTADEVTALAQQKAGMIQKDAEEQAHHVVESANDQVIEIRKEYQEAQKQMKLFQSKYRSLLETQIELISSDVAAADDSISPETKE